MWRGLPSWAPNQGLGHLRLLGELRNLRHGQEASVECAGMFERHRHLVDHDVHAGPHRADACLKVDVADAMSPGSKSVPEVLLEIHKKSTAADVRYTCGCPRYRQVFRM